MGKESVGALVKKFSCDAGKDSRDEHCYYFGGAFS